ncbi:MAG: hypothetical protein ILP16_12235 [Spirochaetales bacterium]|nr:hypothetical protein [Spirochaetales bacterium]
MRRFIYSAILILAILLCASCMLDPEEASFVGTWTYKDTNPFGDLRQIIEYQFNSDGTFSYYSQYSGVITRKKAGTWSITSDGMLATEALVDVENSYSKITYGEDDWTIIIPETAGEKAVIGGSDFDEVRYGAEYSRVIGPEDNGSYLETQKITVVLDEDLGDCTLTHNVRQTRDGSLLLEYSHTFTYKLEPADPNTYEMKDCVQTREDQTLKYSFKGNNSLKIQNITYSR